MKPLGRGLAGGGERKHLLPLDTTTTAGLQTTGQTSVSSLSDTCCLSALSERLMMLSGRRDRSIGPSLDEQQVAETTTTTTTTKIDFSRPTASQVQGLPRDSRLAAPVATCWIWTRLRR